MKNAMPSNTLTKKIYQVRITEYNVMTVDIEAYTPHEAERLAENGYTDGEILMDEYNADVSFEAFSEEVPS